MNKALEERVKIALHTLATAVVETIEEIHAKTGNGTVDGHLYATLQAGMPGLTLQGYENLMSALVMAGRVKKSHQQYWPVKKEGA